MYLLNVLNRVHIENGRFHSGVILSLFPIPQTVNLKTTGFKLDAV